MTDRVVAFDINAARVAAAAPIAARPAPAQRPNRPRHTNRALSRAQLSSVYAGLLGADISVADVLEHLQLAAGSGKLGLEEMAVALRGVGLTAAIEAAALASAKLMLHEHANLQQELLSETLAPRGPVRIGAVPTAVPIAARAIPRGLRHQACCR